MPFGAWLLLLMGDVSRERAELVPDMYRAANKWMFYISP